MLQIGGESITEIAGLNRVLTALDTLATSVLSKKNVWPESLQVSVSTSPVKVFPTGVAWGKKNGSSDAEHRDIVITGYIEQLRMNAGILGQGTNQSLAMGIYAFLVLDTDDVTNAITVPAGSTEPDCSFEIDGRIDISPAEGEGRTNIYLRAPFIARMRVQTGTLVGV